METNKEYDDQRANTRNTKLTRIVREKDKIWTKVIKELPKYAQEFREEFGLIMDEWEHGVIRYCVQFKQEL